MSTGGYERQTGKVNGIRIFRAHLVVESATNPKEYWFLAAQLPPALTCTSHGSREAMKDHAASVWSDFWEATTDHEKDAVKAMWQLLYDSLRFLDDASRREGGYGEQAARLYARINAELKIGWPR